MGDVIATIAGLLSFTFFFFLIFMSFWPGVKVNKSKVRSSNVVSTPVPTNDRFELERRYSNYSLTIRAGRINSIILRKLNFKYDLTKDHFKIIDNGKRNAWHPDGYDSSCSASSIFEKDFRFVIRKEIQFIKMYHFRETDFPSTDYLNIYELIQFLELNPSYANFDSERDGNWRDFYDR
jgi:hypothetical protein